MSRMFASPVRTDLPSPSSFSNAVWVMALVAVAGCRTPREPVVGSTISMEEALRLRDTREDGGSTLGSGDLLEIRVYQETDLSGAYRLSPEGTIDFPLCGKVNLSGMTTARAADALNGCLKEKYIKKPDVTVLVREYNSKKVFVFGEVQKPGTFPYEQDMSIIQAVTIAGGFTKTAAKNNISVTRIINGQEHKIRVPVEDIGVGREKNFMLQPGDIVFVPESFF
jgi:protein involved in polysaccharide export with SLBB domain